MVKYINYNPVHHGLVKRPSDWRYSSVARSFSDKKLHVEVNQLMSIFEQGAAFDNFHYDVDEFKEIEYCIVE